jgi:hypothetical protein
MWILIVVLFILSFLASSIRLSLNQSVLTSMAISFGAAFLVFISHPFSIQINMQALLDMLQTYPVFSSLCILLIFECVLFLLLSSRMIDSFFHSTINWFDAIALYCPSVILLAGMFILQNYLFHINTEYSFALVALACSFGFFVCLTLAVFVFRYLLSDWMQRFNIVILIVFLQLIIAMYLPLILSGLRVQQTHLEPDWISTLTFLTLLLTCGWIGYRLSGYRWRRSNP